MTTPSEKTEFAETALKQLLSSFEESFSSPNNWFFDEPIISALARMLELYRNDISDDYLITFCKRVLLRIDMDKVRDEPNDGVPHKDTFEYFVRIMLNVK